MTEKNVKVRIVLTIATMLTLAMLLQSIVVMFLGIRTSVREDVAWARQVLEKRLVSTMPMEVRGEGEIFSCIYLEPSGKRIAERSQCRYPDKLVALSQQARAQKRAVVSYAGAGWSTFLFWNEVATIAVPQLNGEGQVVGAMVAERSLLPIYSRYKQDSKIVLCYLLVNALLFSSLSFFRISRLFFRPLDSLVQKAGTYQPDEETLFLVSESESPFRKLSTRLNTLFERIERDNRTLRQNVRELEGVNAELQEKNDLVIRSEKLATAGRLSAGLAHEIGNPLAIIMGYLELLARDDLTSSEKTQFSHKSQQELDRIQRLIQQLLDFAGPIPSGSETVSVNGLIRDVVDFVSLEKTVNTYSITTTFFTEDDVDVADKDGLRQVLINCLFNAVDATADMDETERKIAITTSLLESTMSEAQFVICIQDNGTGIAAEELGNVFDPFFTTKEVGKGTGLGLFVCHTIMERLAGTITLRNLTPTGVEVKIVLPLRRRGQ